MTTRPLSPTAIGTLAAVVTVLAWTSFIVGSRAMALRHLQPLHIVLVRVVFAAGDVKRGALGGCLNLAQDASAHHHMEVMGGVLADQCEELLVSWFRQRRGQYVRLAAQVQAN